MKTKKISLPSFGEIRLSSAELLSIKAGNIPDGSTRSKKNDTRCNGSDHDGRPSDTD